MSTGPVWPTRLASSYGAVAENYAVSGSVTGATNLTLQGVPNACGLAFISYPNGSNIIPGLDKVLVPIISTPIPVPTFLEQVNAYVAKHPGPVNPSTIFFLVCPCCSITIG